VLGRLLDAVDARDSDASSTLESFASRWLKTVIAANGLDWRWYFVKYPVMREGRSGIYAGADGSLGYSACMLDKTQMNSWYRDPYLSAIQRESGVEDAIEQRWPNGPWFTGYETEQRWMRLAASGIEIQCVTEGLMLRPPTSAAHAKAFARVCAKYGIGSDYLLKIHQVEVDGRLLDTKDRVELGAALVRDLVEAEP
jgi:hypothetical protein